MTERIRIAERVTEWLCGRRGHVTRFDIGGNYYGCACGARDASQGTACAKGDLCALNRGAVTCFSCGRNWPQTRHGA